MEREARRAARDVRPERCGWCQRTLTGDEISPDYCSEACQFAWSAVQAAPAIEVHRPTSFAEELGIWRRETRIWLLPKVCATPHLITAINP